MKILFFIDNLQSGGKERRFTELLKGLKRSSNIELSVVVMNEDVHYKEIFDLDIKIQYLIRKTSKDLSVFRKFYQICKIEKPNIVHCWDDMTAVISVPTCKFLRIKLVNGMVIDTPIIRNFRNKSWLRAKLTFPFSSKIIGNSKAGLGAYGAPSNKSLCIYNGMDFNRFKDLKDPKILSRQILNDRFFEGFIVGMVAGFDERKDYQTLIKGAIQLLSTNENLLFILVGSGKDFEQIKKSVPNKLSDQIIFLGRRSDVESIVNLFDIGVLLTNAHNHGEGVSNSLIEYMASGKPVIATKGGGTDEVVKNGENGFLIENGDSRQFINFVEKLLNNKEMRAEFGKKSAEIAIKNFDLTKMTKNYISLYNTL